MPPTSLPWPPSTSASASYSLQCHCAAVQFTIKLSPPLLESEAKGEGVYTAIECDCTHCETKGIVACHPKVGDLKWEKTGRDEEEFLTTYLTGRRKNPHWFCKNCGSTLGTDLSWLMKNILVDEEPRVTINLRMLKDIRIGELEIQKRGGMRDA